MKRVSPAIWFSWLIGAVVAVTSSSATAETLEVPRTLQPIYAGQPPKTLDELRLMEEHQQKLAELVTQCTVGIRVGGSQGSGVLVTSDGYILTAAHVASRPNVPCLVILADGTQLRGTTLGLNRDRDAGLVKIVGSTSGNQADREPEDDSQPKDDEEQANARPSDRNGALEFPHLEMAPSKQVKQGAWCLATGHPGGYQRERKPVVRLGRILFVSPTLLRTDCVLVGGDSGGPLCDMQGRVIGIHSRIGGPITMNLHVPIATFHTSWDRLAKGEAWGKLPGSRPIVAGTVMGVRADRDSKSARIGSVESGLPAAKAGIRPGDVILRFDGQPVPDFDTLAKLVQTKKPGDTVLVELRRNEELIQLKVTLAQRKPN